MRFAGPTGFDLTINDHEVCRLNDDDAAGVVFVTEPCSVQSHGNERNP